MEIICVSWPLLLYKMDSPVMVDPFVMGEALYGCVYAPPDVAAYVSEITVLPWK